MKDLPNNLVGKRIRLLEMGADDPCPIPAGTTGTVQRVSNPFPDQTQIGVKWDIPRSLSLVVPPDRFEVID